MARFGLIGSSYSSQSPIADCQRTMNWYPENIESTMGASSMALYPTPGLSVWGTIDTPVRGEIEINGRMFAVGGTNFYEMDASGNPTVIGSVGNNLQPVTMATNGTLGNQVIICSDGKLFIYTLDAIGSTPKGTLTQVNSLQGIPAMVVFCSSYFVALLAGTNKFQVSNLLDGSQWNPLGVEQNETFPRISRPLLRLLDSFSFLVRLDTRRFITTLEQASTLRFLQFQALTWKRDAGHHSRQL